MATAESSIFPSVRYDVIYAQSIMDGECLACLTNVDFAQNVE